MFINSNQLNSINNIDSIRLILPLNEKCPPQYVIHSGDHLEMMASSSPNQHWHWHRHWKSFIFFLTKKFMKNRPFMSNTLLYSFLNLSIRHQNLFATVTLLFTISYPGSTKLISKILESFKVNLQVFVGIIAAV